MKKIILITLVFGAILFSGCASKQAKFLETSNHHTRMATSINIDPVGRSIVVGTQDYDMDKVSPVQNLAIAFKKIAKEIDSDEFILEPGHEVPIMITNFKDLVSYCYPENKGVDADAYTEGSTSLEDKCNFGTWATNKNLVMVSVKTAKKSLAVGTWNKQQVLNDPFIDQLIKNAKKDSETHNIMFFKTNAISGFIYKNPEKREHFMEFLMKNYPKKYEHSKGYIDNLE